MAISMRLGIGGINLVRRVGVRGFHGGRNGRERGRGSGGYTARGCNVAALAVAMETEGCPWPWGDCLVDRPPVIDWISNHRSFPIA